MASISPNWLRSSVIPANAELRLASGTNEIRSRTVSAASRQAGLLRCSAAAGIGSSESTCTPRSAASITDSSTLVSFSAAIPDWSAMRTMPVDVEDSSERRSGIALAPSDSATPEPSGLAASTISSPACSAIA